MKMKISIILFLALSFTIRAQVVEELVYPVVPITDACHFAYDDTATTRIMPAADFIKLKGVWAANNYCLG